MWKCIGLGKNVTLGKNLSYAYCKWCLNVDCTMNINHVTDFSRE